MWILSILYRKAAEKYEVSKRQYVQAVCVLQHICYSWNAIIAKRAVSSNTYVSLPVVCGQ